MKNIEYILSEVNLRLFPNIFRGKSGVYLWTNLKNGKCYVGSSVNLKRRISEYLNSVHLVRALGLGESYIYRAMMKYGYLSFSFKVLEYIDIDPTLSDREQSKILHEVEQKYMDLLKPEYNILKLAGSNRGHKISDTVRAKISAAKKGKPSHRKGITISQESRDLIRVKSAMRQKVYVYSIGNVLSAKKPIFCRTFSSITDCAVYYEISRHRIGRAIKSNKPVDGKYLFKSVLL